MQAIVGTVGEGGVNTASDVALIQVMLMKINQPRTNAPYMTAYDGVCGAGMIAAIRQFKSDHVVETPRPGAVPANGLIRPNDATWTSLVAQTPEAFQNLRVLPEGRTVYLQATTQLRDARLTNADTYTFAPAFRTKVNALINQMYTTHGIALGVCPQGGRRNFQEQYDLRTSGRNVTQAGPGESNHNFGMAVDMGFASLRWIRANGTVVENEGPWLALMERTSSAEALKFWGAMRDVGTGPQVNAFRGPVGDRPHLQNWNDAGVSMTRSLAGHLTRSGVMRWNRGQVYESDLGLGGAFYPVGTAVQIWSGQATITAATLTRARAAARPLVPADARGNPRMPQAAGRGGQALAMPAVQQRAAPATVADVAAMRQALRAEFDRADRNWQAWRP